LRNLPSLKLRFRLPKMRQEKLKMHLRLPKKLERDLWMLKLLLTKKSNNKNQRLLLLKIKLIKLLLKWKRLRRKQKLGRNKLKQLRIRQQMKWLMPKPLNRRESKSLRSRGRRPRKNMLKQ